MQSDFSARGKTARNLIAVPDLRIDAIRKRSHSAHNGERARAFVACAAVALGAVGAAAGFGGSIYNGVHIWLSGDRAAITVRSFGTVNEPTAADLRATIARATFPVIFPVGLPAGTRIARIMFAPAVHPNSVFVQYEGPHLNVGLDIFDSSVVNTDGMSLSPGAGRPHVGTVYQWRVGSETVVVPQAYISRVHVDVIKDAMLRATPTSSIAAADGMLRTVLVLGGFNGVADTAERVAPITGQSVLLDRSHMTLIASLAARNRPMLDSRTIYLDNIPTVHGEPDYSKATYRWPKVAVISPGGVRAIDAVLRASSKCACEILYNRPNVATYWVWELPINGSAPVKKYVVDATTLAVNVVR